MTLPTRRLALALVAALALTGCGDGGDDQPDPGTTDGTVEDGTTDDATTDGATDDGTTDDGTTDGSTGDGTTDGGTSDDGADGAAAPPLDDEASTDDRVVEEEGFGLTLTDVRVGTHDGFDRVTFEVQGDSQLGYNVTVDDTAVQHGSGNEVDVEGDAVVTVSLRGMYLPPDRPEGVDAFEQERVAPPEGAGVITEVVDSGVYEGHHLWFIGTTEEAPIRVVRYEDPQRLVIDVVHP